MSENQLSDPPSRLGGHPPSLRVVDVSLYCRHGHAQQARHYVPAPVTPMQPREEWPHALHRNSVLRPNPSAPWRDATVMPRAEHGRLTPNAVSSVAGPNGGSPGRLTATAMAHPVEVTTPRTGSDGRMIEDPPVEALLGFRIGIKVGHTTPSLFATCLAARRQHRVGCFLA